MSTTMRIFVAFACLCCAVRSLDNGLGLTPAMGYNSWYDYGCSLNEKGIRATADALVDYGFSKLGYIYVNLDDCWAKGRYDNGTVYSDPNTFPSGMKALADYIHSKGLKFGVYTDRGTKTCGGRPGTQDHEEIDAKTYAEWGVDYLKEDSCNAPGDHGSAFEQYAKMRDALNATGRPILYSLCGWNRWYAPIGYSLANSWRIGPDDTNWGGVLKNIDINAELAPYAGPGGWNDPCLLLGNTSTNSPRVTEIQQRSQFSMWSVMASPLLISSNVRNLSLYALETYSNAEVIAVNQDPLGKQGMRLYGGSLSQNPNLPPAHLSKCNSSNKAHKWIWNTPKTGFVKNVASGKCLNVDNCGSDIIYYECVSTGGTCCGKDCYKNESWLFYLNGQMLSDLNHKCVTAHSDGTISLETCIGDNTPSQTWAYDQNSQQLTHNGMCLDGSEMVNSNGTNVWGRELADGSWAFVFLNIGPNPVDISCDISCFEAAGFDLSVKLTVRDLWTHTVNGTTTGGGYTAKSVPGNGGSVMVKFTRVAT
ncbi:probable alpha-galactosidase isoform X3 [Oscarella lobularis]